MAELILHPEAEFDYEAALIWYLRRSRRAAQRFANEVTRVLDVIRNNPRQFALIDDRHRLALLRRFSYLIAYRVEGELVRGIAFPHSHQAGQHWRQRP